MSQSNVVISGERRFATEEVQRSQDGFTYAEHYQRVSDCAVGAVPKLLSRYLSNGPSVEMATNGSSIPVNFDLKPSSVEVYRIDRIALVMVCATAIEMTKFGDIASLTNGLIVDWRNATASVVDVMGGVAAKTLNDLAAAFDVGVAELGASHTVRACLELTTPIRLDGGAGELLRATVQDNLSTLTRLRCHVLGSVETSLT